MKKALPLITFAVILFFNRSQAQTTGSYTIEKKLTDSVCNCVSQIELGVINSKQQAVAAYTECISRHVDLLQQWATERGVSFTNNKAMEVLGVELAQNLMKQNCANFVKLAIKMGSDEAAEVPIHTLTGTFKRIDTKGFNYIVLKDSKGIERSFIWLRQFPGSEKFTGITAKYVGKSMKITSQEMEVYLPAAKGYYKVKEIIAVDVL
jgi:hypothetical protein